MSKIVVSGYYGSKNAGDEAMLAAMLEVLNDLDPKLHITVISANPEDTKKRHNVDAVSWLNLKEIVRELRQADLLISGGGSLLQNVTSRRSLYYYLAIITLARFLGTRVMLYAQGIGPILGGVAEKAMRFIGNRVDMITVRDQGSLLELARLGIKKPPIEVTADPVLAIHPVDLNVGKVNCADGMVSVGDLSQGTADQVYMALRLSAIRFIAGREDPIPLILDDSFSLYDDDRLLGSMKFLAANYKGQMLIFTCQKREEDILAASGIKHNALSITA